ncbi:MAG: toll/interleukin-1 receptor domain-containing protein [Xenococcaceae cyanobacterium]
MITDQFFDAFISYGRADGKAFASKLCNLLTDHNIKVWFDQNDIPPAVDWRNQISAGIERAKNLLFIITPYSIKSTYCLEELETAHNLNKRIIPVLYIRVPRDNRPEPIRKLNWIYFRDEVDDFDHSFDQLLSALHQDQEYVEQHASLYVQALAWSRNQKQTSYLLVGKERQQAEAWLNTQFTASQAPCLPTDLHCEFISESKKNANNLMTDVFLSYAEEDRAVMEEVRRLLFRQGLTIWTNKTDIKSGTHFQTEIHKGIEGADSIVYFLSNAGVHSDYCQQELTYARSLSKRIIPLRIEAVESGLIPTELQGLQYINLPPLSNIEQFQAQTDLLLKALNQNAYYHQEHKVLLVKALKWKAQNQNPSILLRGHNLNHFSDWIKQAKTNSDYPPVPLQKEYVTASEELPAESSLDVFISYSRSDSDFVRQLNEALQMQGKTTWFDQESIPSGSDFQQELYRGIQICDNFLFVISPQSVHSPYCEDEVHYARQLSKRIVTVVYQPVSPSQIPESLSKLQWIDFNQHRGEFYANFNELVRTLDIDREHVSNHTKWALQAMEWKKNHKSRDLLLRGSEFAIAEEWLQDALQDNKNPPVTALQQEFITKSKETIAAGVKREKRRVLILRSLLGLVSSALVVAIFLGVRAYAEFKRASRNQIQSMAGRAAALFKSDQQLDALTTALHARKKLVALGETSGESAEAVERVLRATVYLIFERNRLSGHRRNVLGIDIRSDGRMIASASADDTIKLWQPDGTLLTTLEGHRGTVWGIDFSPNGEWLASSSADYTIILWRRAPSGKSYLLYKILKGHSGTVLDVAFSPDSQTIASASWDHTLKLWDLNGKVLATLSGHQQEVYDVDFSPNGQLLLSSSGDQTVKLWQRVDTPERYAVMQTLSGHQGAVLEANVSPDGQLIATAGEDKTIKLWSVDGTLQRTLTGHIGAIRSVEFTQDSKTILSGSWDRTIKLWNTNGALLFTFRGHQDRVQDIELSPNNKMVVSASSDRTIKLWKVPDTLLSTFSGHSAGVLDVALQDQLMASASEDNTIRLWQWNQQQVGLIRKPRQILRGHKQLVLDIALSPKGEFLASAGADQTINLWDTQGKLLATLTGHGEPIRDVDISPDGKMMASASDDKTIRLWDIDQTEGLQVTFNRLFIEHESEVYQIAFSPDSQVLASVGKDRQVILRYLKPVGQGSTGTLKLSGHTEAVRSVAFSPDGKLLASAGDDKLIKLWKIDRGKALKAMLYKTLEGHQRRILDIAFSPDGQLLASASRDDTVKLWRLDGTLVTTLRGHTDSVFGLEFSPDGQFLASGSGDRRVVLWNLNQVTKLENILAYGCKWIADYLRTNPQLSEEDRKLCDDIGK